ncbi:unnamed protein product [Chrysodeixis includens]|uniref:Uncharacterized protein n=1 Tax=Chrysodeixis includens TaxID=689277 RepID=A0A9P0BT33_CHRIL|nr:unnamed protein product [Chrysodeixis includens]
MFLKLTVLCLLAACAYGAWSPNIKVRWNLSLGNDAFVKMPRDKAEITKDNWVKKDRPAGPAGLESLELWCPVKDYSFCTLLDDTGYAAGIQVGVAKSRVKEIKYDPATTGFTTWTTTLNGATVEYYTIQLYFISADILKTSKESRLAARKADRMLQYDNIWMTGYNGKLFALPLDTSLLGTNKSDFTKQACVPWMGTHYYYKMSKDTTCAADTLFPWFPLVDSNQVIGLGFMSFMKYEVDKNVTDYFEHPDENAVKMIVENGPQCLYDLARDFGVLTMHVYLIESPRQIGCALFG